METRRKILEKGLPKEVAEKAIANIEKEWGSDSESYLNREVEEGALQLLWNSFTWTSSSEGLEYWVKVESEIWSEE